MNYLISHTYQNHDGTIDVKTEEKENSLFALSTAALVIEEDEHYRKFPELEMPVTLAIVITPL